MLGLPVARLSLVAPGLLAASTPLRTSAAALTKANAIELLQDRIGALWPTAHAGFPWQRLVDPLDAAEPARFDRRFWHANVDASERYVLSVTSSSALGLASDASGLPICSRPTTGCVPGSIAAPSKRP